MPAIDEAAYWIGILNKLCDNIIYIKGNHEDRFKKKVAKYFESAWNLRRAGHVGEPPVNTLEHLLCADEIGMKVSDYYPDGNFWVNHNLNIVHGKIARSPLGLTARKNLEDLNYSVLFGHIHRREEVGNK